MIKLWTVDYDTINGQVVSPQRAYDSKPKSSINLLANLDEHTDWVNKVIYIEPVNTLLSCSNDTSLRVWKLKGND